MADGPHGTGAFRGCCSLQWATTLSSEIKHRVRRGEGSMTGHNVQDHYSGEDTGNSIAFRILAALRSVNGSDRAVTPEALEPLAHFNARGVAATQELVSLLEPQ